MHICLGWFYILYLLGTVQSLCVLDTKKGWRLDCGVRDSYLFRIKDIGGIKANFDFGLGLGDEKGFSKSIRNSKKHKAPYPPPPHGSYGLPPPPAPPGYYPPPNPYGQPHISQAPTPYQPVNAYSAPVQEYGAPEVSYELPEVSYELPESSYQSISYRSDTNQPNINNPSRSQTSSESYEAHNSQTEHIPAARKNLRGFVKKKSFPYKFEIPPKLREKNRRLEARNQVSSKRSDSTQFQYPTLWGAPPPPPPFLPPQSFISGTNIPFVPGPPQFSQAPVPFVPQHHQFAPQHSVTQQHNLHGSGHHHGEQQQHFNSQERIAKKNEQFVFRENLLVTKAPPATLSPEMAKMLKLPANTQADTDNVPSFAAQMFVVRNAPAEFYPPKYQTKRDINKHLSVQIPRTKFYCEEQKYLPGIYADSQLGCKMFHLCIPSKVGSTLTSYLCPNGTLFDQSILQCNYWYNVDCESSLKDYDANLALAKSYRKINAAHLDLFSATDNTALSLLSQDVDEIATAQVATNRMGRLVSEDSPVANGVRRVLNLMHNVLTEPKQSMEFNPSEPIPKGGDVNAIVVLS